MQRRYFVLFALCASLMAWANPVDVGTASGIARKFIQQKTEEAYKAQGLHRTPTDAEVEMKLVYESAEVTGNTSSEYYVFAPSAAEGFVIVAGDDKVEPIVGYSLTNNFSAEQIPPALESLLSSYAQYVAAVREGEIEAVPRKASVTPVFPFITTAWNQFYPYNYYCPEINGERAVTGCVATATAQIMNYYEWPEAGHGSCTATLNDGYNTPVTTTLGQEYDWTNMRDVYGASYSEVEAQAVGLLMRDVGYACNLSYGSDATSGYTTGALAALLNHFDYSPGIHIIHKDYYSDAAWQEMLYEELSAGRPIYYAGQSGNGGHAFVCCGMDQYGGYYINWGWGGYSDGYFYLHELGGYSYDQNAIIGIEPIDNGESRDEYVGIPHIGMFEVKAQNSSLSAPSVTFYMRVNNMSADNLSGKIGYALFEDGTMVSSEVAKPGWGINELPPMYYNYWNSVSIQLTGVDGLSPGVREIRFFWQPEGSNEWIDPLGDQCIYMKTTNNGHSFSTVLPEEEVPEIPMAEIEWGLYYLKNVATGKLLTAANDWGTRASIGERGVDVRIAQLDDGGYTIDTQIYESESKHFLGTVDGSLYMDAPQAEWTIGVLENGHYVLSMDGGITFMGHRGESTLFNNVTDPMTDEAVQWQLLRKEDLVQDLNGATDDKPVDATFLILGAHFGRNDSRNLCWEGSPTIDGHNDNFCAEKWNTAAFDVSQVVTGLPNGLYELRVQGFYREGGGANNTPDIAAANYAAGKPVQNALLYANNVSTPLMSIMAEAQEGTAPSEHFYTTSMGYVPQSQAGAATFFTDGLYRHSLQVKVSDGTLRVGVKKDAASTFDWTCFDNFELYYYGAAPPEEEKYEVTFIIDGEVVKRESLVAGATITPPEAPVKEGYTFAGWGDIPATMPAKDMVFVGTYTVNKYEVVFVIEGEVVAKDSVAYGASLTIPDVDEREGYSIVWPELPATMPARDITIEGKYVVNTYTLVYKVDGEIYKTYDIEYNAAITAEPAPEKEGYTFSGWSEIPETMPAEDVEVNGSFTVNTYEAVFIIDGEVVKKESIAYGATITPPEAPVKEGHTFAGWGEIPASMPAKDLTFTGTYTINKYAVIYKVDNEVYLTDSVEYNAPITAEPAPAKEGHTFSGWSEIPETMPANDITIVGTFIINKYLITFIIDGEIIVSDSLEYGSTIVIPEAPEKEGHTFSGWGEVAEVMPAYDLTYEGTYTANTYKVYYYVGDELVHTEEVVYGDSIPEYVYKPAEEGYTFLGWVGEPYETMPAHDVIYIANIDDSIGRLGIDNPQLTIYDMAGRKVTTYETLKGGIYIINGRKVVVDGVRE